MAVLTDTAPVRESGGVEGAPHLMVEVATSSARYDLHNKKEAYRRARPGVVASHPRRVPRIYKRIEGEDGMKRHHAGIG